MKKKLLAMLLAVVMAVGLLPGTAFAGGDDFTSRITIDDVTISIASQTTPLSGEGWSYEPASKTLVLDGFEGKTIEFYEGRDKVDGFTLELRGSNKLSGRLLFMSAQMRDYASTATITGSGSIVADHVQFNSMDTVMKGGTITTRGSLRRGEVKAGMYINKGCCFHMIDGTLNALGSEYGIYAECSSVQTEKCIILEGGTVTAYGDYAAIWLQRQRTGYDNDEPIPVPGSGMLNFGGRTAIGGKDESDQKVLSVKDVEKVVPRYAGTLYITVLTSGNLTPGTETEEGWRGWIGAAQYAYIFGGEQTPEPTEPETPTVSGFTDVKTTDYYADAVAWAVETGVTKGKTSTTFDPFGSCTRAEIVTFLWRACGKPEPTSTVNPFTDVKSNAYYYKAVLWAVENGIVNGTSATTFGPKGTCTRRDAITFLWRCADKPAAAGNIPFTDVPSGKYYSTAVAWAAENGIAQGTGAFNPKNICTRADIVTFLYRQLEE